MKLVNHKADGTVETYGFQVGGMLCGRGGQYIVLDADDLGHLADAVGSESSAVIGRLEDYLRVGMATRLRPWPQEIADPKGDVISKAQRILTEYLVPDGVSADETLSRLLDLLDGPECRDAMAHQTVQDKLRPGDS